ncbi:hypothetical protein RRF57_004942 [Xylaria bambusicola]|uniref:Uncharacterized protein n=1 Tax=Xylaria bambusicola TaxID=326684 RepID=A0AAN7Z4T7_9PEZI
MAGMLGECCDNLTFVEAQTTPIIHVAAQTMLNGRTEEGGVWYREKESQRRLVAATPATWDGFVEELLNIGMTSRIGTILAA